MEVNIREKLQTHWVRLMRDLFVDDLVHHLFAQKILTESMLEDIMRKNTTRDKNMALLSVLQKRGPNAYPVLLEGLVDTGQEALCELLEPGYVANKNCLKSDLNLNCLGARSSLNVPPPIPIPSANSSAYGNVITQTEHSPNPSPSQFVPLRNPRSGSRPNSRPNSLYDKVFTSGLNSPNFSVPFFNEFDSPVVGIGVSDSNGNLCADIAGSPESPINHFPTIFDIDVKMIKDPIPQQIVDLARDAHGVYRNFSNPKGLCLIVNNCDFSKSGCGFQNRDGSEKDASYLSWLFEKLGYKVIIEKDLDAESLENVVQRFAQNPEHQCADSAVVVVLSHGQETGIYCCDGLVVKCKTLMDFMDGELCPFLIKKPKLFFIQACRGRVRQLGYEVPPSSESDAGGRSRHGSGASHPGERKRSLTPEKALDDASSFVRTASGGVGPRRLHLVGPVAPKMARAEREDAIRDVDQPDPACVWEIEADPHGQGQDEEPRAAPRRIPKYSDMLISYSTIPGHVSFRREDVGSWYVQAIVDVFSQHAREKDINSLLTMVNRKVATCATTDHSFKQMPAPVNHLMKDFYFFPGLFESFDDGEGGQEREEEKMDTTHDAFTPKGIDQKDSKEKECDQCGGGAAGGKGRKRGQEFPRYSTL